MQILMKFSHYATLLRLNKPIGILLLLWPTLIALWIASAGHPNISLVFIFVMGVILMRSAGCVINDIVDQKLDKKVSRTCTRPLVTGQVSTKEAVELYQLAADQGYADAQCNLGWCYMDGIGISVNKLLGKKYYQDAANQQDAIAQNNLGHYYENKGDRKRAAEYFESAARQGYPAAQQALQRLQVFLTTSSAIPATASVIANSAIGNASTVSASVPASVNSTVVPTAANASPVAVNTVASPLAINTIAAPVVVKVATIAAFTASGLNPQSQPTSQAATLNTNGVSASSVVVQQTAYTSTIPTQPPVPNISVVQPSEAVKTEYAEHNLDMSTSLLSTTAAQESVMVTTTKPDQTNTVDHEKAREDYINFQIKRIETTVPVAEQAKVFFEQGKKEEEKAEAEEKTRKILQFAPWPELNKKIAEGLYEIARKKGCQSAQESLYKCYEYEYNIYKKRIDTIINEENYGWARLMVGWMLWNGRLIQDVNGEIIINKEGERRDHKAAFEQFLKGEEALQKVVKVQSDNKVINECLVKELVNYQKRIIEIYTTGQLYGSEIFKKDELKTNKKIKESEERYAEKIRRNCDILAEKNRATQTAAQLNPATIQNVAPKPTAPKVATTLPPASMSTSSTVPVSTQTSVLGSNPQSLQLNVTSPPLILSTNGATVLPVVDKQTTPTPTILVQLPVSNIPVQPIATSITTSQQSLGSLTVLLPVVPQPLGISTTPIAVQPIVGCPKPPENGPFCSPENGPRLTKTDSGPVSGTTNALTVQSLRNLLIFGNNGTIEGRKREGLFDKQNKSIDEQAKSKILSYLSKNGHELGNAVSEGDCFFDSVDQGLAQVHIAIPSEYNGQFGHKKLRQICAKYAKNNKDHWLKEKILKDQSDYQNYLATIGYTAPEMEKMWREEHLFRGVPIWGNPHIDGRIICNVLNIKLHTIEIMKVENNVVFHHELTDDQSSKSVTEKEAGELYKGNRVIHLAVYQGSLHYVPLINQSFKAKNEGIPESTGVTVLPVVVQQTAFTPPTSLQSQTETPVNVQSSVVQTLEAVVKEYAQISAASSHSSSHSGSVLGQRVNPPFILSKTGPETGNHTKQKEEVRNTARKMSDDLDKLLSEYGRNKPGNPVKITIASFMKKILDSLLDGRPFENASTEKDNLRNQLAKESIDSLENLSKNYALEYGYLLALTDFSSKENVKASGTVSYIASFFSLSWVKDRSTPLYSNFNEMLKKSLESASKTEVAKPSFSSK